MSWLQLDLKPLSRRWESLCVFVFPTEGGGNSMFRCVPCEAVTFVAGGGCLCNRSMPQDVGLAAMEWLHLRKFSNMHLGPGGFVFRG